MRTFIKTSYLSGLLGASTLAISFCLATPAMAQVTTSSVTGAVTSEIGAPISNAQVSIINTATGLARVVATDSQGVFSARNLPVTGQYNVSVSANGFQGERVEGVRLFLGDATALNFALGQGAAEDEIIVVGQRQILAEVAVGPAANFGVATIESAPAINRSITDIVRLDPRIFVNEGNNDSVQCLGQNPRFNSLTLDGVQINDSFGLNSNGFPTERQPFPFAVLEQVSVEIAPFDVQYGGFTACNINSVTKSGTNELSGGFFVDYTSDSWRGDRADGVDLDFGNFDETRYGFDLGGPIVKDKLFFYAAYEKLEGANIFVPQPLVDGLISQEEVNEIADIARSVYQYDPGAIPTSFANEDEKLLLKLDWNINDQHRAAFTYNYNDGFNIVRSDGDSNELEFSNHLYERGAELNSLTGALFSDWTDNFSTEVRVSYIELDNRQISLGGTDFGEIQVETAGGATVYLGGDDSRQSNDLNYDLLDLRFRGEYQWNDHNISFGYEREDLQIFNLFVQHTETEIRFDSIADFRNQLAQRVFYNNAPSQNPDDAAANWGYAVNTLYLQDEFTWNDFTFVGGLRYDFYETDDAPPTNQDFLADYGFSNGQTLDGEDLLQPRLGFTYDASSDLQIRGGVGLYSGGNPNVWLSNNYSANNVTQFGQQIRAGRGDFSGQDAIDLSALTYVNAESGVPNGPGFAIPTVLFDPISNSQGSNFEINYLDPDFKIPSEWKYALGATWTPDFAGSSFLSGPWMFQTDFIFSDGQDSAIILRGDLVETGTTTFNGQTFPVFSSPLEDSFVLTNAEEGNESLSLSFAASKEWDNGLGLAIGYAYTDSKDINPMTSSVAFSNYNNRAFTNPQEQVLSTSNFNIKHRVSGNVSYRKDFYAGFDSSAFLFFQYNSGLPFSRTQDGVANSIFNFTPFLDNGGDSILQPGTRRNQFEGPSWFKVDLRLAQEFPGIAEGHKSSVFLVIDNLTNLIDSDWGVLEEPSFPGTLTPGQGFSLDPRASTYEMRLGFNYDF